MKSRRELIRLLPLSVVGTAGCNTDSQSGNATPSPTRTDHSRGATGDDSRIDVTEFGAEGDGTADDTRAIQRAIDAASDGETVYFPTPEEFYRIRQSGEEPIIVVSGDRHADDLTLKGDGAETVIKLADDPGRSYAMIQVVAPKEFSFTLENLVFDGNRDGIDGNHSPGHALRFRDPAAAGTGRMLVKNVEIRNANTSGMSVQYGGVTCRRVTTHGNNGHGFVVSISRSDIETPPPLFKQCHSYENGKGSFGTGLDFSTGAGIAEDVVIEKNEGGSATKVSVGATDVTYRRVRLEDNVGFPFQNTGESDGASVSFEDVVCRNNEGPVRLSDDATYTVPDGTKIIATDNTADTRGQVYLTDAARLEADGEVHSLHASGSPGLVSDTTSRGNYIGRYVYFDVRNPVGAVVNLDIQEIHQDDRTDIETVPNAREVGAWSRLPQLPPLLPGR